MYHHLITLQLSQLQDISVLWIYHSLKHLYPASTVLPSLENTSDSCTSFKFTATSFRASFPSLLAPVLNWRWLLSPVLPKRCLGFTTAALKVLICLLLWFSFYLLNTPAQWLTHTGCTMCLQSNMGANWGEKSTVLVRKCQCEPRGDKTGIQVS